MLRRSNSIESYIICDYCGEFISGSRDSDFEILPALCQTCLEIEEDRVYCEGCGLLIPNLTRADVRHRIYILCSECDPTEEISENQQNFILQGLFENLDQALVIEGDEDLDEFLEEHRNEL